MNERELLRKLAQETIYSAKGHFKSCDLRRNLITITLWLCIALNVLGVVGINLVVDKWGAALGLFGTIALLIWNEGEGKLYRARHKEVGEKYLALHKEIRACYFLSNCNTQQVEELNKKIIQLGQSEKPDISGLARRLAKNAIEKNDCETDNWFFEPQN